MQDIYVFISMLAWVYEFLVIQVTISLPPANIIAYKYVMIRTNCQLFKHIYSYTTSNTHALQFIHITHPYMYTHGTPIYVYIHIYSTCTYIVGKFNVQTRRGHKSRGRILPRSQFWCQHQIHQQVFCFQETIIF